MFKYELDHIKERVKNIVMCTNGVITTALEKQKKKVELTKEEKYELILNKKATLKPYQTIKGFYASGNSLDFLFKCFDFQLSEEYIKNIEFNNKIDEKKNDLMHEVELEGKRIIDNVILKLIETRDIPNELYKLSNMANIFNIKAETKKGTNKKKGKIR